MVQCYWLPANREGISRGVKASLPFRDAHVLSKNKRIFTYSLIHSQYTFAKYLFIPTHDLSRARALHCELELTMHSLCCKRDGAFSFVHCKSFPYHTNPLIISHILCLALTIVILSTVHTYISLSNVILSPAAQPRCVFKSSQSKSIVFLLHLILFCMTSFYFLFFHIKNSPPKKSLPAFTSKSIISI